MPQHIVVTEYHSEWVSMFEEEARLIKSILRENCMAVYHIGSTAVPGLKAKPVIDMMPVVHELQKVDDLVEEFVKSGYEYMGEFGIAGRRYLRKGGDERTQPHIGRIGHRHHERDVVGAYTHGIQLAGIAAYVLLIDAFDLADSLRWIDDKIIDCKHVFSPFPAHVCAKAYDVFKKLPSLCRRPCRPVDPEQANNTAPVRPKGVQVHCWSGLGFQDG